MVVAASSAETLSDSGDTHMLAESDSRGIVQTPQQPDLPITTYRPALHPGPVRSLVVQRHDALDALPPARSRRDPQAMLYRNRDEQVVDQSESCRG